MTTRLVAAFTSVAAIALAVLVIPLGISFQRSEERALTARVERDAFVLASLAQAQIRNPTAEARQQLRDIAIQYQRRSGGRVVFVRADGRALFDSDPPVPGRNRDFSSREEFRTALDGQVSQITRYSNTLQSEFVAVAVPVASGGRVYGAVRVTFSTHELAERAQSYWIRLLLICVVMLLAAAVVAWVLARWAMAPLARVSEAAGAVGNGDLDVRADARTGPPEVRHLATSFNEMADRIEHLMGQQRSFIADASHQLRTPLAALQLELDNLALSLEDPAHRERTEELLDETERLSALVNELLALARADASAAPLERVELKPLIDERLARHAELAAQHGVSLSSRCPDIAVMATEGATAQIIDNFLDNALAVSPRGGHIEVSATSVESHVLVTVRDQGPGIDPEDAERAFDRFWRSPEARGPGSGLGLPIARELARASGGDARLEPAPEGGTDAIVELPAAD